MDRLFCVYRHIRLDKNTPFYIGKGYPHRSEERGNRNQYWHNIVNKAGYQIEIIIDNLTESEAFQKEKEFIKLYKSLGYCEANLTDGGEGSSKPMCQSTKNKIRKSLKRVMNTPEMKRKIGNIMRGRVLSEQTRKKISQKLKGKRSGKCNPNWKGFCVTPTGTFETASHAAKILNLSQPTICKRCYSSDEKWKDWFFTTNPKHQEI